MKVKSYDKFLESNSDEYSIYDWYFDLRHSILTYQETKNYSDQFIGPGIFTKIDKKCTEMFAIFDKIDLGMIDDMMVDLYDYVPQSDAVQSDTAILGTKLLVSIYPSIPFLIGVGLLFFYEINKTMEDKIETDLSSRRER